MELFKLNSAHLPSNTITLKDEDSFIWTERYDMPGDFVLTVENDITILTKLPYGTLISHTDTLEVMMVETHDIKRDKDKKIIIEITGRTFEVFSEHRITNGCEAAIRTGSTRNAETLSAMTSSAACVYILKYSLEQGTADAADYIPNLLIVNDVAAGDTAIAWQVKRGTIHSQILEWLKVDNCGIRNVRPNGAQTTLNLVVHKGVDRTLTVSFSAQNKDIYDVQYLRSIKEHKNYARVSADTSTHEYRTHALGSDVTGMNRRVMYVEAQDLEGTIGSGNTTPMAGRAQEAMDSKLILSLMQANVAVTARPRFKFHYDVGDIVTIYGEFDSVTTKRIVEHILTVDKEGIRGYPGLADLTS